MEKVLNKFFILKLDFVFEVQTSEKPALQIEAIKKGSNKVMLNVETRLIPIDPRLVSLVFHRLWTVDFLYLR